MAYTSPSRSSGFGRILMWLLVLVLVGALGYFLYHRFFAKPAAPPTPPPPSVSVYEVKEADIPLTFEYAGRTAGSREVEIRARVSGILQKRAYTEGEAVKAGQLLFVIDPAPFQAALAENQARASQAESDWKRVSELYQQKAVSGREYDEAKAAYEQTRATTRTARINLNYTTVTAPISGVTSKEGLSEGSLVTADTSLLTRVTQLDPIYVDFAYPDAEAMDQRQQVAQGLITLPEDKMLRAEIHFGDGSAYPTEGKVSFTDSIIDTATGTVRARAVLPNPDRAILPGQFVRVVVKGFTRPHAIAIPDQAIMQGPQGTFVYLVSADGKAKIAPITLGQLQGNQRVVRTGLKPGDKVITEGTIKVKPDQPVTVAAPAEAQKKDDAQGEAASASRKD